MIGKKVEFILVSFGRDGKPVRTTGTVIDESGHEYLIKTEHGYICKKKEAVIELA